jgi:hypothetical protein
MDVASGNIYEFTGLGVDSLLLDFLEGLNIPTEIADDIEDIVNRLDLQLPQTVLDLSTVNFDTAPGWVRVTYPVDRGDVTVGGDIAITAVDNAGIYSNVKIVSSSITTNDGGAAVLQETINDFIDVDFQSSEGEREIDFGQIVRVTDDYAAEDFSSDAEALGDTTEVKAGERVLVADGYDEATFSNDSGNRLMVRGDTVRLTDASFVVEGTEQKVDIDKGEYVLLGSETYRYLGASTTELDLVAENYADTTRWELVKGDAGALYRYIGEGGRGLRIDLGSEDYTDATRWVRIGGDAGTVYEYLGSTADLDLNLQDYSDGNVWKKLAGAGGIYVYMGTTATLDLNAVDYTDQAFWKQKLETTLVPQGYNVPSGDSQKDSDAIGVGIVFAVNDVRSAVEAFIADATVDAASVSIEALEIAVMRATTESSAKPAVAARSARAASRP